MKNRHPNLCHLMQKQANWVWYQLRQSRIAGYQLGETSVTDFFVKNLLRENIPSLQVTAFTARQESVTGADFEFWFTGSSGRWCGLRFQAKILNFGGDNYPHLHYKNQLKDLVADAKKYSAVPLYLLYSNWEPSRTYLRTRRCCRKLRIGQHGVTLLDVVVVGKLKKTSKARSLVDVAPKALPLQCLFCCTRGPSKADLPGRIISKVKPLKSAIQGTEPEGVKFALSNPPTHIERILNADATEQTEMIEALGLRHLLIFRERQDDK